MLSMISSNYRRGIWAEIIASLIYRFKFYRIIHRRYKTKIGEVDLIARRGKTIVFIEVKYKSSEICERVISEKQRSRIRRAAEYFLYKHPQFSLFDIRFDAVIIQKGNLPVIIENAF